MTVYYPESSIYEAKDDTILKSGDWSAPPNGYSFDGVDDYIGVSATGLMNFGLNGFAIELFLDFSILATKYIITQYQDANNIIAIYYAQLVGGILQLVYKTDSVSYFINIADIDIYSDKCHLIITSDRTNNKIYINSIDIPLSTNTLTDQDITNTGALFIGSKSSGSGSINADIYKLSIYNHNLTATQVSKLFNNGRPCESHLGSEYFTEGAGATQTSGTLTTGKYYRIKTFVAGDDFTNVGAASNATGVEFLATGTTPTTYTNGSTLEKLGETFRIDPTSVGIYSAYDKSGNGNNATVNGATPLAKNDLQRAYKTAITGDTTLTSVIQASYYSEYFVITNTTANAVTINVGTTAGGTDVISGLVIGANATILTNAGLYHSANATYYVSSADWNSSSLNIKIMSKLI